MTYLGKPKIFIDHPEIVFGFSKKEIGPEFGKFNNNMSYSINDDAENVERNREDFFGNLGLDKNSVIIQKQVHSNRVNYVEKFTENLEGDALITGKEKVGLGISTADCTNIYIFDPKRKLIAAVHSGWAGTEKSILLKTLDYMFNNLKSEPENLLVYFGPSITVDNYEVGLEFKDKFNSKYLKQNNKKYKLDLITANLDMLFIKGVKEQQIEVSSICSFDNKNFHSFRRDKNFSGRALGIIAMKSGNE